MKLGSLAGYLLFCLGISLIICRITFYFKQNFILYKIAKVVNGCREQKISSQPSRLCYSQHQILVRKGRRVAFTILAAIQELLYIVNHLYS
jgi:hypothetical protein